MKTARKWICAMLALVMLLSVMPLQAAAADSAKVKIKYVYNKKTLKTETIEVGDESVTLEPDAFLHVGKNTYALKGFSNGKTKMTIPAFEDTKKWHDAYDTITIEYKAHTHKYYYTFDRMAHKQHCACGKDFDVVPHIDPLSTPDSTCTCGYKFSDNTDLTTLWFNNVRFNEKLQSGVTEYTGSTVTYYDINRTWINAVAFDAKAVIELPTDLSIQEGVNTFKINVTAEDKRTVTTYVFTVIKPAKIDGVPVSYDGKVVTAEPKTTTLRKVATTQLTENVIGKVLEVAADEGYEQIVLKPSFSKWSNDQVDVAIPAEVLTQMAEIREVSLTVTGELGTVTIPHEALTTLSEGCETLTISIVKNTGAKFFADGTELTELPEGVVFALPEV